MAFGACRNPAMKYACTLFDDTTNLHFQYLKDYILNAWTQKKG